jgi:hypothetical protein
MRLFLTQRRNLKRKPLDIENTIRQSLEAFSTRLAGVPIPTKARPSITG